MKKVILAVALLFLWSPVYALSPVFMNQVVEFETRTYTGVSANMSLVSPVLVTNVSPNITFNLFTNRLVTVSDGSGSSVFTGIAAGSGETVSETETITGFTNGSYNTFTTSEANITSAEKSTSGTKYCYQNYVYTALALYKSVITLNLVSGQGPYFGTGSATTLNNAVLNSKQLENGANTKYHTVYSLYRGACGFYNDQNSSWSASSISFKQVLTPSTAGFTATGVTDSGINPNAASFTVTVSK